jgi:LysR family transcriptional regulator, transcriptional activator of nhaA
MEHSLSRVNYHHLHYFWAVAHDGLLTRTAARLRVSQSALSSQIKQLEEQLATPLFERVGRRLQLTEAGRVALAYADDIFRFGDELVATLRDGRGAAGPFRVGAQSTLSRNFQESFLRPLIERPRGPLRIESGRLDELIERLGRHELDLVLSNQPARRAGSPTLRSRRVARQAVSLVGKARPGRFRFPRDLAGSPMILPSPDSDVRAEFDALCASAGVSVSVLAEVDDMATMRLLARDTGALTLVPSVVVRDELRSGALSELWVVPGVFERFYAISAARHFQHPLVAELLRHETELLGDEPRAG